MSGLDYVLKLLVLLQFCQNVCQQFLGSRTLGLFHRCRSFFLLLVHLVYNLHHHEDAERNDEEVDDEISLGDIDIDDVEEDK